MHGNKGKKRTEEQKKRLSKAHKGQHNSFITEFKKGSVPWNKGKKGIYKLKHDKQFKRGNIPWNKGGGFPQIQKERNHNWKGGITPIVMQVRNCLKYRQWRSDIFTRDNFTCVLCGKRGTYLEADHYPKLFSQIWNDYNIKAFEEALNCEELWNLNNGRTLCRPCHLKTYTYGNKK